MRVNVEGCWAGNERFHFRLTFTSAGRHHRERVRGEVWTRAVASEALDILENLYGADRASVRFRHR